MIKCNQSNVYFITNQRKKQLDALLNATVLIDVHVNWFAFNRIQSTLASSVSINAVPFKDSSASDAIVK